ncbi:MAG: kelch motif-containing protein [Thermoplasmata archaeon]|nr:kelch motif-containing protein [Thermoplasmata archaeon]
MGEQRVARDAGHLARGLGRTSLIVFVLAVVVTSSALVTVSLSRFPAARLVGQQARSGSPVSSSELASAASSLALGGGPASGTSWSCSTSQGSGSYSCSPPRPTLPPASSGSHNVVNTLPDWTRQALFPPSRDFAAMTYDAADKYVVLFGGSNGSFLGDTWSFNGFWTHLTPATSPSNRSAAAFAYDYKDGYALLFGGLGGSGRLGDTWKFLHGAWTHLIPVLSPPALDNASMVWDTNDSYLLLFGGSLSSSTVSGQTWSFVSGAWTQRVPSTSPAARQNLQLGYDNTNGWVVLFAGETSGGGVFSDTWNYTRGHWTQLHPSKSPTAVFGGSFTNDSADGYLLLFGGRNSANHNQGSTWSFVNVSWTQQTPAVPPSARAFAGAAFLKTSNKVVLIGGLRVAALNDTWTYHANVWTHLSTSGPSPRAAFQMAYDEADGYVLLFGGAQLHGFTTTTFGDTWAYSHGHWSQLKPAVSPMARIGGAMTYDQGDGYIVLFGGQVLVKNSNILVNDTWTFVGGKWTQDITSFAPNPRDIPGLTYDAADGYVLLFGGLGYGGNATEQVTLNDSWTFSAGIWTVLTPHACTSCGPAPSGRAGAAMVYDPWDGYVLLFGGENLSKPILGTFAEISDTWTFSAGVWTNITTTAGTPPGPRAAAGVAYDGLDGYVLIFGGTPGSGVSLSDTWSFVGGTWTQLFPAHNPGPDYLGGAAFDATDHTMLYLNGISFAGGTWLY